MGSKTIIFLGLTALVFMMIASEVGARDLAESETDHTTTGTTTQGAEESKYGGYGGGGYGHGGGGYGHGGGGYGRGGGGYGGGGGGYGRGGGGYGRGGGGYGRHCGCCGSHHCGCCSAADQAAAAATIAATKPQN